jgi:uncharacterized delta-60 repeat protein
MIIKSSTGLGNADVFKGIAMRGLSHVSRRIYASVIAFVTCFSAYSQSGYDFNWIDNGWAYNLAVQPDGKILVAEGFYSERLNPDGKVDQGFQLAPTGNHAAATIYCLAVQPDGKIVAGGRFDSVAGVACTNLCRMNPDGTVDTNFMASANAEVFSIAVQPDGKLVVGGGFTLLNGQPRASVGRVNRDGSIDETFNPGTDGVVFSLAVQEAGRIFVGGSFYTLGGTGTTNLGRLMASSS